MEAQTTDKILCLEVLYIQFQEVKSQPFGLSVGGLCPYLLCIFYHSCVECVERVPELSFLAVV